MSAIAETFFHYLMDILDKDPSAVERLDLECGICLDKMTIDQDIKVRTSNNELVLSHGAYILVCGHIFGVSCAAKLSDHSEEDMTEHRCPTCRHALEFTRCFCPHNLGTLLRVTPEERKEMADKRAASMKVPEWCFKCGLAQMNSKLTSELIRTENPMQAILEVQVPGHPQTAVFKKDSKIVGVQISGHPPTIVFKKNSKNGRWRITKFTVGIKSLQRSDIDPAVRRGIDVFVNASVDTHFVNAMVPEEASSTEMVAEIGPVQDDIKISYS
ncbi:hypothetical protein ACLX1H_010842 [Fusarium chlamydosporum]